MHWKWLWLAAVHKRGYSITETRGSTYTSESYLVLLRQNGMLVSMSRTANCYDNAMTESFFHSLKGENLDHESFQTRAQARNCTFE
jgi:putative transposase